MLGFISAAGQVLFTISYVGDALGAAKNIAKAVNTSGQKRVEHIKEAAMYVGGAIISGAAVYAFSKLKE